MQVADSSARIAGRLTARNPISSAFFAREADRLALVSREMAERFARGGRLLAFGQDVCATDAQHVAVEFVHPVIVGKRALPAIDISASFATWLPAILRPDDIVIGFAPAEGAAAVAVALEGARQCGAQTLALPGGGAGYGIAPPSGDAFIDQEIVEILYHTLWETVHVFLEHAAGGADELGDAAFLYPFLSGGSGRTEDLLSEVAASIRAKAAIDEALRQQVADAQAEAIGEAAARIAARVASGGSLVIFGNGGSATDANDWALDCAARGIPATSLSMDPACVTAILNDVGRDEVFLRQLIAQARPGDVAIAISTSGGSSNVIAALVEAKRRGMLTVALLGYDGGEVLRRGLADHALVVACDAIPRIQEVQATIYHVLTESLVRALSGLGRNAYPGQGFGRPR